MVFIKTLAEFFKHCLNVGGNVRPNKHTSPLWCGWMRCYIKPYLINGKVNNDTHPIFKKIRGNEFCKFKNLLLYTLQDYIDFIYCFPSIKDINTIQNTKYLISELEKTDEDAIIKIIENNRDKFPSTEFCDNENIIDESYNIKLNTSIINRDENE